MANRAPPPLLNSASTNSNSTDNWKGDQKVEVKFAGSGLSSDLSLGPTPLVSISRDYIKDGAGSFIGINTKVNLDGHIHFQAPDGWNKSIPADADYDPSTNMNLLLTKEDKLSRLLRFGRGDLEIYVEGQKTFEGKNAKVISYNADKTPDAWGQSIKYNIDFEFYEPLNTIDNRYEKYYVSSINESWSIEPTENYIFTSLSATVSKQIETEPSTAAALPTNPTIYITGMPQFRITRRLSAVGLSSPDYASHFDKNKSQEYNFQAATKRGENDAYLQAKKWVDDRLELPFSSSENPRSQFTSTLAPSYSFSSFDKLFLYNHNRTINYSISEGSYEINDTWLALPSGVSYIEDFTIESSTDEKYVKTVKVQGTIRGLQVTNSNIVKKNDNLPSRSTGKLLASDYNVSGESASSPTTLKGEKYENAKDAWIDKIKPYIYSRACIAVNSPDRNGPYYDPSYNGGTLPPGDPTKKTERLLNYIPVSTSESHDPLKGIVGYTYEYNNNLKIFSGVIAESVTITTNGPGDQVAEIFVLGRPLGPVLQALGTKTSTSRSVNIELVVPPPTTAAGFLMKNSDCPVWTGGYIFQTCEKIIEGQKPYGQRYQPPYNSNLNGIAGTVFVKTDTYAWDASEGKYTRNIEWVYQPCDSNISDPLYFLKHHP